MFGFILEFVSTDLIEGEGGISHPIEGGNAIFQFTFNVKRHDFKSTISKMDLFYVKVHTKY